MMSHLRYFIDTFLVADPNLENLWSIKVILSGFELASRMRVNFFNNSLIVVSVDYIFLSSARDFLQYKIDYFPFKYLVLIVGANPRLETTLDPLANLLKKRLKFLEV